MVIHELLNVEELHNPMKGKLDEVAEYFIKFYGEEHRQKILDVLHNTEFVFVDPIDESGKTSFQIYFDSIRERIMEKVSLELSTKGIKVKDNYAFLKNAGEVERLSQNITPEDCETVIDFLCAFDTKYMPENLQLLADKTVTKEDFSILLQDEGVQKDLKNFFANVNEVYERDRDNFEQLDDDQRNLGFDKRMGHPGGISANGVNKIVSALCDLASEQFDIPKSTENKKVIFDNLNAYVKFIKGEFNDKAVPDLVNMLSTFYNLSSNKEKHAELGKQLSERKLNFDSPYFANLQKDYSVLLEKFAEIFKESDLDILSQYDDTKHVVQTLKNSNLAFDEQLIDAIKQYKFERLRSGSEVDSLGMCVFTITKQHPHQHKNFIVLNSYLLLQDRTIFHEINHAIQTSAVENGEDMVIFKVGVPSALLSFSKAKRPIIIPTFEDKATMFNEVLNDYLTEKIFEEARGKTRIGYFVESGECYYPIAFPFLRNFFDRNMDVLKECALSEDPYSFLKRFKKSDIEDLIDLTDDLMKYVRENRDEYVQFVATKVNIDNEQGRNVSIYELNEDDFNDVQKEFIRFYKKFDEVTSVIQPIDVEKNEEDVKENTPYIDENHTEDNSITDNDDAARDENDDGRDE